MNSGAHAKSTARALGASNVFVDIVEQEILELVVAQTHAALTANRSVIWPSVDAYPVQAELVLVPLSRLSGQAGFSGSHVFIAYFRDGTTDEDQRRLPSLPFVVKVGEHSKLLVEREVHDYWPATGDPLRFALPFFLGNPASDGLAVLIAPFSSRRAPRQSDWDLHINDLWSVLTSPGTGDLPGINSRLLELLHLVHQNGRTTCERQQRGLFAEYEWYLRGMDGATDDVVRMLGSADVVYEFGKEWRNPVSVLAELRRAAPVEVSVGPLHGDLHPKNVVLDADGRVCIIDYGWAHRSGHVVKDFILLDLNYRAITAPARVPTAALLAAAQNLVPGDRVPCAEADLEERLDVIRDGLWEFLLSHRLVSDWRNEYLVPMFLVAYGLIKYVDEARNQNALLITLLSLATRLMPLKGQ